MVKTLSRKQKPAKAKKSAKRPMMKSKIKKAVKSIKKSVAKRKTLVKKVAKKITKKLIKKTQMKKKSAVMAGQLGKVVHYYDKIGVAIVELSGTVMVGDILLFKRGDLEFIQPVSSMQINHMGVEKAGKGKVIGVKVIQKAEPGTVVMKG